MGTPRDIPTPELQPRPSISSAHRRVLLRVNQSSSGGQSSETWPSTSGDIVSDTDEVDDRGIFVDEYNRLAGKYGVRSLVPDSESHAHEGLTPRRSWWSRTFRKTSRTSSQSTENSVKRRRSVSHVKAHVMNPKRDSLKDQDLQGLVRLCGKSFLYLPPEYAPGSLVLPTCFRATAQCLIQYAPETRGVFRIPGSVRVVNELYEYYCAEQPGEDVANTVRSPNLPPHINAGVHDVASAFKKFLAGVPGGILGSLSLFDALVAINSQLYTDLEISKTKQSKIRARLIALAVGTVRSQFRRELICAVFGLLCMLGRAAETTPREDEYGRPLPTSDLMGYNALGIVFGPLLVGDILGSHAVKLADPTAGVFLVPASPNPHGKLKKKRKDGKESLDEPQQAFLDVDKVHIANDITEMLIANWRDVIKQMKSLDGNLMFSRHHTHASTSKDEPRRASNFRTSEDTTTHEKGFGTRTAEGRPVSHTASSSRAVSFRQIDEPDNALSMEKTRTNSDILVANSRRGSNLGTLSPPKEEPGDEDRSLPPVQSTVLFRSSLKPANKRSPELPIESDPGEENEYYFTPMEEPEPLPIPAGKPRAVNGTEYGSQQDSSKASSVNRQSSKTSKSSRRSQGSPRRLSPNPTSDHDLKTAYTVSPRAKILSGKSTMRFQPRSSDVNSMVEPVKRTPTRQSAGSGIDYETGSKKAASANDTGAGDQVDGAVDLVVSAIPCRKSSHELRGEAEKRGSFGSRLSLIPVENGRFELQEGLPLKHHDIDVQPKRLSRSSQQSKRSLGSLISGSGDVELGASKVMGLAAMFDNAAKACPLVPTPGGPVHKARGDSPTLVSPYTSNTSPRTSIHSMTSISTPPSLISHVRNSTCSAGTAGHSERISITPRRRDFAATDGPGSTQGQSGPGHSQRAGDLPNKSSRIVTPSRLPVRKKGLITSPPSLIRLHTRPDYFSRPSKLPVKATTPQGVLPKGYYSTPTTRINSYKNLSNRGNSYRGLTHRSQTSTTSTNGETLINSRETSPLGHSPTSVTRSASSLRDQIRSLRQELSSKNEECAQLLLELQESRKANSVSEVILREDLDRYIEECVRWKQRTQRAERKIDKFEQLARRIKDARETGNDRNSRGEDDQDGFSFTSGPDHLDICEPLQRQRSAKMNQGSRRAPENGYAGRSLGVGPVDNLSDCSRSTVVRNLNGGREGGKSALWATIDELVDLGLEDDGM